MLKEKRKGTELEIKTFYDSDNRAKDIAKKLGVEKDTTVEAWNILWQN